MARVKEMPSLSTCKECHEQAISESWTCGCITLKGCVCARDENGLVVEHGCGQPGHSSVHDEKGRLQ